MAKTLSLFRGGAVGFIDWLDVGYRLARGISLVAFGERNCSGNIRRVTAQLKPVATDFKIGAAAVTVALVLTPLANAKRRAQSL